MSFLAGRSVLQIIPELEAGGAERTTVDIAEALSKSGAQALVATRGGRLVEELETKGGRFIPFPAHTKNPFLMLVNIFRLVNLIRTLKVDVIHARSRAPAWVALAAARLTGIPFVTTWHGSYSARNAFKELYNSVMARGDRVIANSNWTAERIKSVHPSAAITVIPRGTDLTRFNPEAFSPEECQTMRALWGAKPEEKIILLAARITPWKGHRVMLEAASQLQQQAIPFRIVFAGDAQGRLEYVEELKAQAAQKGMEDILCFAGHVADIPLAQAASDCIAVPSIEPEAFGRVAVEAQAMGKPVIVTDNGAMAETVLSPPAVEAPLRTGWVIPAADSHALASALTEALSLTDAERAALAQRGRERSQDYTLEAMTAATLQLYAEIMQKAP